jgi:hypothetical protein
MLCNVSFGILAFSPTGWGLMLLVILLEGFLLAWLLPTAKRRTYFITSFVANAASGAVGFVVSIALTGGWWLVIWVPWVTAYDASREQWPNLGLYMLVAYVGSIVIESLVAKVFLRKVKLSRVFATQALINLVSSLFLLGVFWNMGGVPGNAPR